MPDSVIGEAQNSRASLDLLRAQRRLYSQAKSTGNARLAVVAVGAVATVVASAVLPWVSSAVAGGVGGVLLVYSLAFSGREKSKAKQAAAVQEQFDCELFGLPWSMLVERPTPAVIFDAATTGDTSTTQMQDWYPDVGGVQRPFDVLLCQRSNLGWGATLHRQWAAVTALLAATALIVLAALVVLLDAPAGAFVALLAPLRESIELVRAHQASAAAKASLDGRVMTTWRDALTGAEQDWEPRLREVQTCVLQQRLTNASVPDWYHRRRRPVLETSMRAATDALRAQVEPPAQP